jgi:hypothetical protein
MHRVPAKREGPLNACRKELVVIDRRLGSSKKVAQLIRKCHSSYVYILSHFRLFLDATTTPAVDRHTIGIGNVGMHFSAVFCSITMSKQMP